MFSYPIIIFFPIKIIVLGIPSLIIIKFYININNCNCLISHIHLNVPIRLYLCIYSGIASVRTLGTYVLCIGIKVCLISYKL